MELLIPEAKLARHASLAAAIMQPKDRRWHEQVEVVVGETEVEVRRRLFVKLKL
jgi:hypothetical protein